MNPPKKFEKDTMHAALDVDGDGVITDAELQQVEAFEKAEKMEAQKKMAWVAMITMIFFTAAVFLPIFPDARIKALADLFSLFYIGMASCVGAYMGATAYMSRK